MSDLVTPKMSMRFDGDDLLVDVEGRQGKLIDYRTSTPDEQLWAASAVLAGLHSIEFGLAYIDIVLKASLAADAVQDADQSEMMNTINYWTERRLELLEFSFENNYPAADRQAMTAALEDARDPGLAIIRILKLIAASSNEELEDAAMAAMPLH